MDPRYTGKSDNKLEAPECFDPEVVEGMEFEAWAIWLGKWFAHHYAAWISGFNIVEQTRGQRQTGRNDLPGKGERVA